MSIVLLIASVMLFVIGAFLWIKSYSHASYICLSIGLVFLIYPLVRHYVSSSSASLLPMNQSSPTSSSLSSSSLLKRVSPNYPIVTYPPPSTMVVPSNHSNHSNDLGSSSSTPAGPFLDDVIDQLIPANTDGDVYDDDQVIQQAIQVSDAIASVSTVNGQPDDSIFSQKTLRSIGHAINQLTLYFAPGRKAAVSSEDVVQALNDTRQVVLQNKPPRSFYKTAASVIAVGSVAYLASRSEPVSSFVQTVFDTWVQGLASVNEYGKNANRDSSSSFFSSSSSSSLSTIDTSTAYSFTRNVWRLLEMSRAEMKLFWNMHLITLRDLLPHPIHLTIPVAQTLVSSSSYPVSLMKGPLDLLQNPIQGGMKALGKVRRTVKQWMMNIVQPGRVVGEGSSFTLTSHDELLEMVVGTFVILMVFGTVLYDYFGGNSSYVPQQQFGRKKSRHIRARKV